MAGTEATAKARLQAKDFIAEDGPESGLLDGERRMISVVVPVLNEVRGLAALESRLGEALEALGLPYEVIIVDDGSTDGTRVALAALHARNQRFKALLLSRNFGKEIAVAAGLRHAKGDAVVIIDGDLQHPPETIRLFVARWQEGYDVVYGERRSRTTDTTMHRAFSSAFYKVFERLSGTHLPEGAGDFRLLDRKVVDALNRIGERVRFNKGLYAWVGFKSIGVPYDVEPRLEGTSRWRPLRLMSFALDGLATFTTIPLRVWSYIGLGVSLLAFSYAVVFLVKTMIWGVDSPGFPTLIISIMLLSGIQLISLGVIGEYLGRVYEEVKGRPLYIVSERLGLETDAGDGPGAK